MKQGKRVKGKEKLESLSMNSRLLLCKWVDLINTKRVIKQTKVRKGLKVRRVSSVAGFVGQF